MSIELGIGTSSEPDVFSAGEEAARQVISHLAGRKPQVTVVFSATRFAHPRLLKGIRSVTGNASLVGCTDAGSVTTSGPKRRCVTIVGLIATHGKLLTGLGRSVSQGPTRAGEMLASQIKEQGIESPVALLMFPDGLAANAGGVIQGVQKRLGTQIPISGAAAGDDFFFQKTFQYFNDEILTDAVPGVLFCGDIAVGLGVRHGWVPIGRPRRVTRSAGHVVYQLDGRPAVSIYEDYLGIKREDLMQEKLANVAITYPLGLLQNGGGEFLLRGAIRTGRGGSLVCTGEVASGSTVRLMIGGYESALEAAQQAAHEAVKQVGRDRIQGALVFCSVARQKMLGSEFQGEIDVIRDALGGSGVRMGGFYSYGELAPQRSKEKGGKIANTFHNESVVVMAMG